MNFNFLSKKNIYVCVIDYNFLNDVKNILYFLLELTSNQVIGEQNIQY